MGWYLKKSLAFGPLRLNLSKSGIGASVGVRGLRVSAGAKGRQISAGREGLYYRASLDSRRNSPQPDPKSTDPVTETANEDGAENQSSVTHGVATAVGLNLGNQLMRAIFSGLFKRR
jgi:hypothetical protein